MISVMGTGTELLAKRNVFSADSSLLTYDGHKMTKRPDGSVLIQGFPIFRAGTFRDSWDDQMTWTPDHMRQIVDNFNMLKGGGLFPDVPVRRDHSFSIDKVIGYFENLSVGAGDMLLCDYAVTEPDAVEKIARGTFRSRSFEVGMYETNDGAMYFPVAFGFAFVDIPAVEGLHSKDDAQVRHFSLATTPKETALSTQTNVDDRGATPPSNPATTTVTIPNNSVITLGTPNASGPAAAAPAAPATFRVNGAETNDFAAVQAHIDGLETEVKASRQFAKDTKETNRKAFVTGLASANKIAAPQVEALTELAVGMTDEQFAKFQASYEAAPVLSVLSQHGGSTGGAPGSPTESDERAVLEASVKMHRQAGLTEDEIAKTASGKKLAALNANKN
jgi:hypothetical protein